MSAPLEDRLARSLQSQAARLRPAPAGLADAVIRRGRRVRLRRRVGALACLAAIVAGASSVASLVRTDPRGLPGDTYATTPDPGGWAQGLPSPVPYLVGSLLIDGDAQSILRWDGLEINSVWEADGGYVIEAATQDVTVVLWQPARGARTQELAARVAPGTLVVSADGRQYAWNGIAGGAVIMNAHDEPPTTSRPPISPDLAVTGFIADERGFLFDLLLEPRDGGSISVWDFSEGGKPRATGWTGTVFHARVPGVALATIDGCVTALDETWAQRWRDCGLIPDKGAVSPNGTYVVAVDQSGAAVVKRAATGTLVGTVRPADAAIEDLQWESSDKFVLSVTPVGGVTRLARCGAASGQCEWAGPPPPYDRIGTTVDLVLGHPINAPWPNPS